ncbi:MAG: hypothetical protein RIG82_07650 [Phycisphaeraceae bacterium]
MRKLDIRLPPRQLAIFFGLTALLGLFLWFFATFVGYGFAAVEPTWAPAIGWVQFLTKWLTYTSAGAMLMAYFIYIAFPPKEESLEEQVARKQAEQQKQ